MYDVAARRLSIFNFLVFFFLLFAVTNVPSRIDGEGGWGPV